MSNSVCSFRFGRRPQSSPPFTEPRDTYIHFTTTYKSLVGFKLRRKTTTTKPAASVVAQSKRVERKRKRQTRKKTQRSGAMGQIESEIQHFLRFHFAHALPCASCGILDVWFRVLFDHILQPPTVTQSTGSFFIRQNTIGNKGTRIIRGNEEENLGIMLIRKSTHFYTQNIFGCKNFSWSEMMCMRHCRKRFPI